MPLKRSLRVQRHYPRVPARRGGNGALPMPLSLPMIPQTLDHNALTRSSFEISLGGNRPGTETAKIS